MHLDIITAVPICDDELVSWRLSVQYIEHEAVLNPGDFGSRVGGITSALHNFAAGSPLGGGVTPDFGGVV